jgi:Ca2+-transporting ATPase
MAADKASVLRDGQLQRVPATDLAPGDIMLIEEGDTIPADGRLIQSIALQTAEASLTGESLPVSKDTDTLTRIWASATARTWSSAARPPPMAAAGRW